MCFVKRFMSINWQITANVFSSTSKFQIEKQMNNE